MFFNGLRIIVNGIGRDVPLGAFADGNVLAYDAAGNVIKGVVPGAPPATPGRVIQVVRTESSTPASTTATIPQDNTIPQNTEGGDYPQLDTTITPTAASSALLVEAFLPLVSASVIADVQAALFRDAVADAVGCGGVSVEAAKRWRQIRVEARVLAGSTAPTTFRLRYGGHVVSTSYLLRTSSDPAFYNGTLRASMTVTEVSV